jgi:hypothetical protein
MRECVCVGGGGGVYCSFDGGRKGRNELVSGVDCKLAALTSSFTTSDSEWRIVVILFDLLPVQCLSLSTDCLKILSPCDQFVLGIF